jgi:hypothetical protein
MKANLPSLADLAHTSWPSARETPASLPKKHLSLQTFREDRKKRV